MRDPAAYAGYDFRNNTVQLAVYEAVQLGPALVLTMTPIESHALGERLMRASGPARSTTGIMATAAVTSTDAPPAIEAAGKQEEAQP